MGENLEKSNSMEEKKMWDTISTENCDVSKNVVLCG